MNKINTKKQGNCFYCNYPASRKVPLEGHHVFGNGNSEFMIWICNNCHRNITLGQQKGLPKICREKQKGVNTEFASLSLVLHLETLGKEYSRILKEKMIEENKK